MENYLGSPIPTVVNKMQRRDFLTAGSLTFASLSLPNISLAEEKGANEKSVILIFLAGGASQAEFTSGAVDSVDRYKAINGYIKSPSGFYLGADFPELAGSSKFYTVVRGFSHINSAHNAASHYVLTGYNTPNDSDLVADHPAIGSIAAKSFGTNNPNTGMPRYVSLTKHVGQRGSFLGSAYDPLLMNEEGKKNLGLNVPMERFLVRKQVLDQLNRDFNKRVSKNIDFNSQAYNILLGKVKEAFSIEKESIKIREIYGKGFGQNLLMARRLVESGVRMVTVSHGGWDNHTNISKDFAARAKEIDTPIAVLLHDLEQRGMLKNTLVIIATEFGRTAINKDAGRDHYSRVTPLILAGGNYQGGNVIGELDKNGFEVKMKPYSPIDLLATTLDHLGINNGINNDLSGRPRYILEGNYSVIQ